jgi:fatty-acyl-CoA synthase
MLCYTSGTTGNPKGVLYEHRSTVIHAMAEVCPDVFDLSRRAVVLPDRAMFHAAAWGLPFAAPIAGPKIVFTADYTPSVVCDLLQEEGVTHTAAVPTVWLGLMNHVEEDGARSRQAAARHHWRLRGTARDDRILPESRRRGRPRWGMTEMSPIGTTGGRPHDWDGMSFEEKIDLIAKQGRAPFGVEMRIVDDAGAVQPARRQELGPAAGARAVGDRAIFPGNGARGRRRRLVRHGRRRSDPPRRRHADHRPRQGRHQIGGEWISSIELENAAMGCAGVAEAAAVGVAHPKWDERPILLVVRKPGADVTAAQIIAHLSGEVAKWWLPDEILFVDSLPHTATGKLLKTALREQYRSYQLQVA